MDMYRAVKEAHKTPGQKERDRQMEELKDKQKKIDEKKKAAQKEKKENERPAALVRHKTKDKNGEIKETYAIRSHKENTEKRDKAKTDGELTRGPRISKSDGKRAESGAKGKQRDDVFELDDTDTRTRGREPPAFAINAGEVHNGIQSSPAKSDPRRLQGPPDFQLTTDGGLPIRSRGVSPAGTVQSSGGRSRHSATESRRDQRRNTSPPPAAPSTKSSHSNKTPSNQDRTRAPSAAPSVAPSTKSSHSNKTQSTQDRTRAPLAAPSTTSSRSDRTETRRDLERDLLESSYVGGVNKARGMPSASVASSASTIRAPPLKEYKKQQSELRAQMQHDGYIPMSEYGDSVLGDDERSDTTRGSKPQRQHKSHISGSGYGDSVLGDDERSDTTRGSRTQRQREGRDPRSEYGESAYGDDEYSTTRGSRTVVSERSSKRSDGKSGNAPSEASIRTSRETRSDQRRAERRAANGEYIG